MVPSLKGKTLVSPLSLVVFDGFVCVVALSKPNGKSLKKDLPWPNLLGFSLVLGLFEFGSVNVDEHS